MRRILSSRLGIVALVLVAITLITSVTWAAASTSSGPSSTSHQGIRYVGVQAVPLFVVPEGQVDIAGGGFDPGELVLMEIVVGGGIPNVILRSGFANDAGAFLSSNARLPAFMQPGMYSISASTLTGRVASAPLVVCVPADGKCA